MQAASYTDYAEDCRVVLSQIGSMFNIPELYGALVFPSLRIDSVAWPFK